MEVEFHGGWVVVVVVGGGGVQSHFRVKPNLVEVELGLWQLLIIVEYLVIAKLSPSSTLFGLS